MPAVPLPRSLGAAPEPSQRTADPAQGGEHAPSQGRLPGRGGPGPPPGPVGEELCLLNVLRGYVNETAHVASYADFELALHARSGGWKVEGSGVGGRPSRKVFMAQSSERESWRTSLIQ